MSASFIYDANRYYAGHNGLVAMRKTGYGGSNDGVFYLLNDQLQSTSRILNRNNTIAATLHYFPYGGNRIWPTVSTLTTKRFTGQYQEIAIPGGGLYYYGARGYDAFSGRFISADTIVPDAGNPQDLNRYSYVRNNPVKYTDLTRPNPERAWNGAFGTLWEFIKGGSQSIFGMNGTMHQMQ